MSELREMYAAFLELRDKVQECGPCADYSWYPLPNRLSGQWMAYSLFLKEQSAEIANALNDFRRRIMDLTAWGQLLEKASPEEKVDIVIEFVDPVATVALGYPYVMRSRLLFSTTVLSHQVNQIKTVGWADDLPIDKKIYMKDCDSVASGWKAYGKLKLALEAISNKEYQRETFDFRNSYNHRYSPRFEVGETSLVQRSVETSGSVSYSVGSILPFRISSLIPILKKQHVASMTAYEKFRSLIEEQTGEIIGAIQ